MRKEVVVESLGSQVLGQLAQDLRLVASLAWKAAYILGWIIIGWALIDQEIFFDVHLSNYVAGVYDAEVVRAAITAPIGAVMACLLRAVSYVALYRYQNMLAHQTGLVLKNKKILKPSH